MASFADIRFRNPLEMFTQCTGQLLRTNYVEKVKTEKKKSIKIPTVRTCRGSRVLLLLSVRNTFSSTQVLGPSEAVERGNFGGAMTLLEKGFFMGEI